MPGSGPPDPSSQERLHAVIDALRAGTLTGLNVSPTIKSILLSTSTIVSGNQVFLSGSTCGHYLYEVGFPGGSWAFLSPSVT